MRTIIFKPTYRCNLKCTYCYERDNRDAEHPLEMTKEQAKQALDTIISISPEELWEVIWHGGESSILGLDYIKEVIDYLDCKYNIHWGFQTNGTLLTDEWLDYFASKKINIGTSWDGFDNNITRNSKNFFDLLERSKQKHVTLGAIYTMTTDNINQIIPSFQYSVDKNFSLIFNSAFGIGYGIEEHAILAKALVELFDYICKVEDCYIERPFDEILSYIGGQEAFFCEGKNCVGNWYGIHPNGNIYSCGKPWGEYGCIGNVFKDHDNIKEVTDNAEFRLKLRKVRIQQLEECRNCEYVIACRGKCPFTGFDKNGNYSKDKGQCVYNKIFFDGCLNTLESHLNNNTLNNNKIISALNKNSKVRFQKWKNYKSPITAN